MRRSVFVRATLVLVALDSARPAYAQLTMAPVTASGQAVTPVFEGWYRNPDGSFSISFGYFNRNSEEVLEIPIGANNFIAPGDSNQGQPTQFQPRRNWGVFAVRVPANFGSAKVVWTIKIRGQTYAIPGRLHPDWEIDAVQGEAGSGNTPPVLKLEESGPEAQGPAGVTWGPITASAGKPVVLTVWAKDDGRSATSVSGAGRGQAAAVTLAWFKHQGVGTVSFTPATARVTDASGKSTTSATFSTPGDYIIRVRANDASGVANAGHAQCCWTNGFVRVTVTP